MSNDSKDIFYKLFWKDIRHKVFQVEPVFSKLIDDIDPDCHFPLYLASYPYGAVIADTNSTFIPTEHGLKRISDQVIKTSVYEDLKYGESLPMGIVLEKNMEYTINIPKTEFNFPRAIYKPGSIFPFSTILGRKIKKNNYSPNGVLITTAGVRSAFILPNISCVTNHMNLQRDYAIQTPPPKTLHEHWYLFKEILKNQNDQWLCKILYFSGNWVTKINTDPAWLPIRTYLLELAWERFEYDRNRIFYDIAFSIMQNKRNLKPNPYLVDTARHLFSIALGEAPGFAPAINAEGLPLSLLKEAFNNSYQLKKYPPIIMEATTFQTNELINYCYYSLQHPCTHSFSPKSRRISSTLYELRELEHIMRVFQNELVQKDVICSDTIFEEVAKNTKFQYFHNELDSHNIIQPSFKVEEQDKNFSFDELQDVKFPQDAKFFRGCISISKNI